jgi:anti-sigma regulatory factor (Ser/Thr protein kinase)
MDEFTISIPRERPFAAVAGLVVAGIAARHDVTLDVLDDLQLALDGVLERSDDDEGEVTIEVRVEDGTIETVIGPVTDSTAAELEQETDDSLGLRRLLETVVDSVTLSERDGGSWVELRKGYELAENESA